MHEAPKIKWDSGYTNLKKHIEVAHNDAYECYRTALENSKSIEHYELKYSKLSLSAFSWF